MTCRLTWNRAVNHRGECDSNHPNDLDLDETCPIYILIKDKLLSMGDEEFCVYVEGVKVKDCDNFFQYYVILVAAIYVFNLVYPKTWMKSLTFVQNVLIGLKDQQGQGTLDRRILSVLTALNSLIPQQQTCMDN